ncbi:MAG: hypothetical protein ABSB01_22310, partial [Streptosporangiaceae bacterium]
VSGRVRPLIRKTSTDTPATELYVKTGEAFLASRPRPDRLDVGIVPASGDELLTLPRCSSIGYPRPAA